MKNHLYKAALVAALGLVGVTAANATQASYNDITLGFTSQSSGANSDDYIVDLGALPTGGNIAANYNTALNVSGFNWSTFTSAGTAGAALSGGTLYAGLFGGNVNSVSGVDTVWISQVDNGTGSPAHAGSGPLSNPSSATGLGEAAGLAPSITVNAAVSQQNSGSYYQAVAETPTLNGAQTTGDGNVAADLRNNPLGTIGSSESIVYDLWTDTATTSRGGTLGSWAFDGTVTVTLNSANDSLTAVYDEVAVPEPATYGILGGLGVLLLGLRRQLTGKLA